MFAVQVTLLRNTISNLQLHAASPRPVPHTRLQQLPRQPGEWLRGHAYVVGGGALPEC